MKYADIKTTMARKFAGRDDLEERLVKSYATPKQLEKLLAEGFLTARKIDRYYPGKKTGWHTPVVITLYTVHAE